jgi:hypothetical protein
MQGAGPMQRIGAMLVDFDPAIGAETMQNFEPAVPVTSEALLVAALALLVGWGGTHLCAWPIRRRWQARREARRTAAASGRWT